MSIELRYINPNKKYLLAVSGGIDSMVMASMFIKSRIACEIVHCNFNLRAEESDNDMDFVENFAKEHSIPFNLLDFDTENYARQNGMSIQIAARKLRYEGFEELIREKDLYKVAIAHNADDNIETFFINLLRGAGLNGLHGIKAEVDNIVRPILHISRKELEEYALFNHISFRYDSSNSSDKYVRNAIRHHILPEFDKINPSFRQKATESISYLEESNRFILNEIDKIKLSVLRKENDMIYINIDKLTSLKFPSQILFYLLEPYGFKGSAINKILESAKGRSGKLFFSESYILVKDRTEYIISHKKWDYEELIILEEDLPLGNPECYIFERDSDYKISYDRMLCDLDADKIKFPLILRKWQDGDRFFPLGMKGSKKVSDYLVDKKISLLKKQTQKVLISENNIVWLCNQIPDDRYKIDPNTKRIFRIRF